MMRGAIVASYADREAKQQRKIPDDVYHGRFCAEMGKPKYGNPNIGGGGGGGGCVYQYDQQCIDDVVPSLAVNQQTKKINCESIKSIFQDPSTYLLYPSNTYLACVQVHSLQLAYQTTPQFTKLCHS